MEAEHLLKVMVICVALQGCVIVIAALVMVVTLAFVVWRYLQQFSYPAELALRRDAGPDYAEHADADAKASGRTNSKTPPGPGEDTTPQGPGGPTGQPLRDFDQENEPFPT